jgi:hypothetical protein
MATRGDRVLVHGYKGREAVLRVWESRTGGLVLSSEDGYRRLMQGDLTAPLVGFPTRDVKRVLDPATAPSTEQSRRA